MGCHVAQAMVDKDLPVQLRKTWQINLDQLQLVMDGQQKPVTLGRGAYGMVIPSPIDVTGRKASGASECTSKPAATSAELPEIWSW